MNYIYFDTIDSTNEYLKNNYTTLPNLSFVRADYQTSGKGRNNREWYSFPKQNLLFSYLIKENIDLDNPGYYGIYSSIVIAKYLESLEIKNVSIKWPNDVYVSGKKICGILSIGRCSVNKLDYVIVGIGLNVNQKYIDEAIIHPFTSLSLETSKNWEINQLCDELFPLLENMVINIKNNHDEYEQYLKTHNYLKDKEVNALINNEMRLVKVIDIVDGNILVKDDDKEILLSSGEVTFHL